MLVQTMCLEYFWGPHDAVWDGNCSEKNEFSVTVHPDSFVRSLVHLQLVFLGLRGCWCKGGGGVLCPVCLNLGVCKYIGGGGGEGFEGIAVFVFARLNFSFRKSVFRGRTDGNAMDDNTICLPRENGWAQVNVIQSRRRVCVVYKIHLDIKQLNFK